MEFVADNTIYPDYYIHSFGVFVGGIDKGWSGSGGYKGWEGSAC